jgi:RHS repeat-associated protein
LPGGGNYLYTYDLSGQLVTESDPVGSVTSYGYDAGGRLISTTHPSGRTVVAAYNAAGRQTSLSSSSDVRSFSYDPAGRLAAATSSQHSRTFEYDQRGLMVGTSDEFGITAYSYDAAHRLVTVAPPTGPLTTYTYRTNKDLLATVRGPTNLDFTTYDRSGRLLGRTAVSPSKSGLQTRGYDAVGRMTKLWGPIDFATIAYHPEGQIASITGPGSDPTIRSYDYDDAGRLVAATSAQGGVTLSTLEYYWDADGNRTSVSVDGQPPVTADYDPAGRLTTTSDGTTYTYDADGQLIAQGDVGYAYNGFGELVAVTTPTESVTYARDPLGRVAGRTASGVAETYGYERDSSAIAAAQVSGGPVTTLARHPDGTPLAATTAGVTQQAYTNIHGDLAGWKDDTGSTVRWTGVYDPFGNLTATTGTAPLPLGFQAMRTDPGTGLVDMRARQYDPTVGRFTTPDTVIGALPAPASFNRYLYGNGDPVNYTDPDGHWPRWLQQAVSKVSDAVSGFVESWSEEFSAGLRSEHRSEAPATRFITSAIDTVSETVADTFRTAGVAASCAKQDQTACGVIEDMATWQGVQAAWHATTEPVVQAWRTGEAEHWGAVAGGLAAIVIGGRGFTHRFDLPHHKLMPHAPTQHTLPAAPVQVSPSKHVPTPARTVALDTDALVKFESSAVQEAIQSIDKLVATPNVVRELRESVGIGNVTAFLAKRGVVDVPGTVGAAVPASQLTRVLDGMRPHRGNSGDALNLVEAAGARADLFLTTDKNTLGRAFGYRGKLFIPGTGGEWLPFSVVG